jgi:hypothetical protein
MAATGHNRIHGGHNKHCWARRPWRRRSPGQRGELLLVGWVIGSMAATTSTAGRDGRGALTTFPRAAWRVAARRLGDRIHDNRNTPWWARRPRRLDDVPQGSVASCCPSARNRQPAPKSWKTGWKTSPVSSTPSGFPTNFFPGFSEGLRRKWLENWLENPCPGSDGPSLPCSDGLRMKTAAPL